MKNLQDALLYNGIAEDEIDQALDTLPLITPPPTLVDNIMAAVAQLPLPQTPQPDSIWDHLSILRVSLQPQCLS